MYTTISTTTESYSDSKYTVADILSSMANGHVPVSLPYSTDPLPPYTSGIASTPTSILTPSTLANIEQTFIDLQSAQVSTPSQSGGFVPPLIDPVPSTSMVGQGGDYTDFYPDESSSDPEWTPGNSPKRSKLDDGGYGTTLAYATSTTPQRKTPGPRRRKNEQLTPEEERRREVRRERNKLAAAKCRQRRVDLTNRLLNESDGLEDERSGLETEIQSLQQQKEQLEFLLQAHKPVCNAKHIKQEKSNMAAPCATIQGPLRIPTPASSARPNSLALPVTTSASAVRGGVFTLGLDSLADGHTGLTPLMGTPLMCTPTTVPTCSAAHRTSSDSSPSDTMASPTTLMAL